MFHEDLPLKLYQTNDSGELKEIRELRLKAYIRHVPELKDSLLENDLNDFKATTSIFAVRRKDNNKLIGTMRVEENTQEKLRIERVINLPEHFQGLKLAEANRLACAIDPLGVLAKKMLFKAFYLKLVSNGFQGIVLECRKELEYLYEGLLIPDLVQDKKTYVQLPDLGGLKHRVFGCRVSELEDNWRKINHPLRSFIEDVKHSDIMI